jgi:diguanylate cyclase (GGDEF)-like protein
MHLWPWTELPAWTNLLLVIVPAFVAIRCAERGASTRPIAYSQLACGAWLIFESLLDRPAPSGVDLAASIAVGMASILWLAISSLDGTRRSGRLGSTFMVASLAATLAVGLFAMPQAVVDLMGAAPAVALQRGLPLLCMAGLLAASFRALLPLLRHAPGGLVSLAGAGVALAVPGLATLSSWIVTPDAAPGFEAASFLPISVFLVWLLSPRNAPTARVSTSIDPMLIVESGRGLVHANESAYLLLGVGTGELRAARSAIASIPELRRLLSDDSLECREFFSGESAATRRCHEVRVSRAEGAGADLRVVTIQDVTARRKSEQRLYHQAHFDSLTGLANRRYFVSRMDEVIERQSAKAEPRAALMLLDLDRFKEINDSYGHAAGDELLRIMAHRLRQQLRQEDLVATEGSSAGGGDSWIARLGGDEFAVMISGFESRGDVERVAERVLRLVGDPVMLQGRRLWMAGSLGIALYPEDGQSMEELASHADIALYHAKAKRRSSFEFYAPSLVVETQRKAALDRHLRGAIAQGELALHYQPKVDLGTHTVHSAEALLRWESAEHGSVPPKDFIPVAEEFGFIDKLGSWVIDSACRQINEWCEAGIEPVPISVNVSALQFQQVDLLQVMADSLAKYGIEPSLLEVELTESAVMDGDESTTNCLEQLRSIGVRVALDDFGTGYSALGYLSRVPLDVVKLDRAFIRDIHLDPSSAGVVTAVVSMAHSLGLEVVAEGADCVEQLDVLRESGCDLVQGFVFSPAVDPKTFIGMLQGGVLQPVGTLDATAALAGSRHTPQEPAEAAAEAEAEAEDLPALRGADLWTLPAEPHTESEAPDVAEAPATKQERPTDRYVLLVDSEHSDLGLMALRLNRLGVLALYARVLEEGLLFALQESGRIFTLLVSPEVPVAELRMLASRIAGDLDGAAPSVVFVGDASPSKEHRELFSDGCQWVLREPVADSDLTFVMQMAMTALADRSLRLRARAPVDLMTAIREKEDAAAASGVMVSLSSGGAYLACEPLPIGTLVDLEFTLEDGPVLLRAKVLYQGNETNLSGEGIGVGFVGLDADLEARLEAAVAERAARCLA